MIFEVNEEKETFSTLRSPKIFWHNISISSNSLWSNIGISNNDWWSFLKKENIITTGFDGEPGDRGEQILRRYIAKDKIIAYANGQGAVGWGILQKDPASTYRLIKRGSDKDFLKGQHLHRIEIEWKNTADRIEHAIPTRDIKKDLKIHHPMSTSAAINDQENAERLIDRMKKAKAFQS